MYALTDGQRRHEKGVGQGERAVSTRKWADASYREYRPSVAGQALKATIDRQNNYQQAGERYRAIAQWERDDLITNLVDNLRQCDKHIQERMVWHFTQCDPEYGRRVAEGLGLKVA